MHQSHLCINTQLPGKRGEVLGELALFIDRSELQVYSYIMFMYVHYMCVFKCPYNICTSFLQEVNNDYLIKLCSSLLGTSRSLKVSIPKAGALC